MMALPEGYTRVKYLQSSGAQYINTEFIPDSNTRAILDIEILTSASRFFFGSRTNSSANSSSAAFTITQNASGTMRTDYGSTEVALSVTSLSNRITIDKNKNVTTANGTSVTNTEQTFAGAYPIVLLSVNTAGTVNTNMASARIYSCQIYDNNTLVRNYVPVVIDATGEAGLYDLVNGVFAGNAGSGAFTAGERIGYARDEIIPLEYIESSGTQYIDTEFVPNNNTRVVMDVQATANGAIYYGCRASSSSTDSKAFVALTLSAGGVRSDYYGTTKSLTGVTVTDRIIVDQNKNVFTADGSVSTHTAVSASSSLSIYLGAINQAGAATTISGKGIKIFACQIYDNGALVRDYIPAKIANGAVGLWNFLDGAFYTDAAGGSFIAGPEIQTGPEAPAELAYTISGDRISLSWSASEGADGYRVYMDGARVLETTETVAELTFPLFTVAAFGVSAYNADGESGQTTAAATNFPENPITYLITDRAEADVRKVIRLASKGYDSMTGEERNEWDAGLKGAYKASDLNRVQAAMAYLADRLNALGYYAEAPHQRVWTASDMPEPSDMAVYLSDVEKLRAAIPVMSTTPDAPPDAEKLTYSEANDIEQILVNIETLLNNMAAAWFYSGEIYSGEV